MALVEIECPDCATTARLPVGALLLDVDVAGDLQGDDGVAAGAGWACSRCERLVSRPIGWATLRTLVSVGAPLLEDADDVEDALR